MRKRLLLIACFTGLTIACFAQNAVTQDSVQTEYQSLENAKKTVILSGRAVLADMKANNPEMYSQYRSEGKKQKSGIIMTSIGGGLFMMGAIFSILPDGDRGEITSGPFVIQTDGDMSGLRKTGPVFMAAGAVCASIGLPILISGGKKKKQILQDFKEQYYLSQPSSPYFQMNISPNGVGIAYMF